MGPKLFREFLLPHYVRYVGFLKSHGVKVVMVDTDGDHRVRRADRQRVLRGLRPDQLRRVQRAELLRLLGGARDHLPADQWQLKHHPAFHRAVMTDRPRGRLHDHAA